MYTKYTPSDMEQSTISARVNLNNYTNKILGIIKIKFGLRDKSEALNKFIELYGTDILERESTEEYTKKVIKIADKHFENYKNKKITQKELDLLFEK
ncbi:DUF2683 family protein [Candidatus Pacearchaeota archaeon]|nr:DUF2683 family protein [Candidatus Pacearchaeota archaeon]